MSDDRLTHNNQSDQLLFQLQIRATIANQKMYRFARVLSF